MNSILPSKTYFFCGIGGSGMMPLALILQSKGHTIIGSDRAYDQGASPEKFNLLTSKGVSLFPQDGSGLANADFLVVSGAIEDTVPDVAAAKAKGIAIKTRAEILSSLFNDAPCGISIAGTSGKSTVTGMVATIFDACKMDPTVMNGGMITNFDGNAACPAANMRVGQGKAFITETDESDGSIALYNPAIAALNNIALDHMPLDQLKTIFSAFLGRASRAVVVNMDDPHIPSLLKDCKALVISYGIDAGEATLRAHNITYRPDGVDFTVQGQKVSLGVAGRHNVLNALAALGVAIAAGIDLNYAINGLERFTGIKRRLQVVGTQGGVTVIDDFGHNPDKIAATLETLKQFDGRLLVMFQAHGFAPLRLMGDEIVQSFARHLAPEDELIMPEVYYAGGTVDRSVTAKDIIAKAEEAGIKAKWFVERPQCAQYLKTVAKEGDRIVIMGARDDSLTDFAKALCA